MRKITNQRAEELRIQRREKRKSSPLTHEQLLSLLDYNPLTGIFIRKVDRYKFKAGEVAGSMCTDGYYKMTISDVYWPLHRLAWFYVYGSSPTLHIDHIDGDRSNNRIANLREVTPAGNSSNKHKILYPYMGVRQYPNGLWRGMADFQGTRRYTEYYSTPEEARDARQILKARLRA